MLEIKGGGFPQIDLFNRLLINNIHRLQRALNERMNGGYNNRNLATADDNGDPTFIGDTIVNPRIEVDSFFPFTSNSGNSAELSDILTINGGLLVDGSVYDAASVTLQAVD